MWVSAAAAATGLRRSAARGFSSLPLRVLFGSSLQVVDQLLLSVLHHDPVCLL
jgi:hypothetical protein